MQFTFGLFEMLFRKKPSKYIALFKMNEKKKERDRKNKNLLLECFQFSLHYKTNHQHIRHGVNRPRKRSDSAIVNQERNQ